MLIIVVDVSTAGLFLFHEITTYFGLGDGGSNGLAKLLIVEEAKPGADLCAAIEEVVLCVQPFSAFCSRASGGPEY